MKTTLFTAIGLMSALSIIGAGIGYAQSGGGGRGMMERFEVLDADTDGLISASEATEWRETVFLTMDADQDNQLIREEYMAIQLGQGADPEQRGRRYDERQSEKNAQFTAMDADGDGQVTYDQFLAGGQLEFQATDSDKSGSVSLAEFMESHWM